MIAKIDNVENAAHLVNLLNTLIEEINGLDEREDTHIGAIAMMMFKMKFMERELEELKDAFAVRSDFEEDHE